MSNLRRQAAAALGDKLQERLNLPQPPTVISAPPSAVTEYPSVAIWLEKFNTTWAMEDELELDSEGGQLLVGARAQIMPSQHPAYVADGQYLSKIGVVQGTGRIWVGCRLPPLREQVEARITNMFGESQAAIGRLMLTLENPVVNGVAIPWSWPVAVFTDDSEWTDEYAFAERQWAWIHFEMCMDVLVLRSDPRIAVGGLILGINADTTTIVPDAPEIIDTDDAARVEWFGQLTRDIFFYNLVVGLNKIPHTLGRPLLGVNVTPTLLTAAFGFALDTTNPHPESEVWISVTGAQQTHATIEVY